MQATITVRVGEGQNSFLLRYPAGTSRDIALSLAEAIKEANGHDGEIQITEATLHGPPITREWLMVDRLARTFKDMQGHGLNLGGVPLAWRMLIGTYLCHVGYDLPNVKRGPFNVSEARRTLGFSADMAADLLVRYDLVQEVKATFAGRFPNRWEATPWMLSLDDFVASCIRQLYADRWRQDIRRHAL